MKDWLYYRIYAKPRPNLDWYDLLKEVVRPFISENDKLIESFFFLCYQMRYGIDEGLEKGCEQKFEVGEWVRFIRLRVLAEQENLKTLDERLNKSMDETPTVIEREKCTYDEKEDLGGRFGETRRELVRKYLEYASRITLSLLDEPQDDKYYEKICGLIHLPSNMLNYRIVVTCPNCKTKIPISL